MAHDKREREHETTFATTDERAEERRRRREAQAGAALNGVPPFAETEAAIASPEAQTQAEQRVGHGPEGGANPL
ncbi:hypothetical protein QT381_06475 [Galbitalea sp. SE-J8]|uniref:hypothetical protein n=1 Tax=Galbitalea sp. SE-J8 TaxID=3054952 RepID=UPI00259C7866|nr:hypothetical protein [Galbitalea sp. SE-J8]MDM4762648.1 hypothetical protein [Galbitalea sp. SE-J8]